MSIAVTVLFFGPVREAAGVPKEALTLPAGATGAALLDALRARHPELAAPRDLLGGCILAVDDAYADAGVALTDGCTVALIPPVSGG